MYPQKTNSIKMTYDIVFKKFFTDKPKLLKLVLKHFLDLNSIQEIRITNPEIPGLEETNKQEKQALKREENQRQNKDSQFKEPKLNQRQDRDSQFKEPELNQTKESLKNNPKSFLQNPEETTKLERTKLNQSGLKTHDFTEETTQENSNQIGVKDSSKFHFLDSSLPVEDREGKRVFLDLRVQLSTGTAVNVEVQTSYKKHFLNRMLYYWAKLHAQSLKKGEGYDKITPTYSLIFTEQAFLDKKVRDFMSSFSIRRDKEPYIVFNKDLRIVIVELSKMDKLSSDLLDFKELWCYFLKKSGSLTREDRECLSRHEELEEAMSHFDKLSQDERMRNMALDQHMAEVIHDLDRSGWIEQGREEGMQQGREEGLQQGREEGMQQGREEGLQQGRQEERQQVVLNMLKKKADISFISKVTGLPEKEIKKFKNGS